MLNAPRSIVPHAGFNPTGKHWEELYRYLIPREPDRDRLPTLNKAWHRLFRQPAIFVAPQFDKIQPLGRHKLTASGARSYQKTGNWCGALVAPDSGAQFVLMFGEWTVPELSEPPAALRLHKNQADYHCVTWIGFDGDRRYFNASLPQVGTEQVLTAKGTKCSAWFQWWSRDQVGLTAYNLNNVSIESGMTVMAMIWAYERDKVSVAFRASAPKAGEGQQDKLLIFSVDAPQVFLSKPGGQRGHPEVSGATAEWIMERPQTPQLENASFLPFPQYKPVRFENCVVGSAPIRGHGPGAAQSRQACSEKLLVRPRLVRLFESVPPDGSVERTRLLSLTQQVDPTTIEVRYCAGLTTPREVAELAMHRDKRP